MWRRVIASFFFSNWFLGVLAISLSLETNFQLGLDLNTPVWYTILFSAVVLYYSHAYLSTAGNEMVSNPRTNWYGSHLKQMWTSQILLLALLIVSSGWFIYRYAHNVVTLPVSVWIVPLLAGLAALSYYGKLRFLNLRISAWPKPFTIGFCWAVAVSILPLIALQLESSTMKLSWEIPLWLFVKNWIFCSINAVLFDIKDYQDDSNQALKTFVVTYGVRFTILFILLPAISLGVFSFLLFAGYRNFNLTQILINLVPFLLTFFIALSLRKEKSILYYLIVIDGTLLVKSICGITASFLTNPIE